LLLPLLLLLATETGLHMTAERNLLPL